MRYYVCLHRQEKRYWKNRKAYKKSRHQRPIERAINRNGMGMSGIKYWVKEDEDSYTDFNDRILAFRYAKTIGAIDIYMYNPDATFY